MLKTQFLIHVLFININYLVYETLLFEDICAYMFEVIVVINSDRVDLLCRGIIYGMDQTEWNTWDHSQHKHHHTWLENSLVIMAGTLLAYLLTLKLLPETGLLRFILQLSFFLSFFKFTKFPYIKTSLTLENETKLSSFDFVHKISPFFFTQNLNRNFFLAQSQKFLSVYKVLANFVYFSLIFNIFQPNAAAAYCWNRDGS